MKMSVIIPVWNGEAVLEECLSALLCDFAPNQMQVICVDNASADNSAAVVRMMHPDIQLMSQPVNLGFAGGVNVGAAAALGELIVLLNQDCIVAPGWLDSLVTTFAEHHDCGIVGAVIEDAEGAINHAGATITRPLGSAQHLLQVPERDVAADYVTGAIFAVRRSVWERLGGLDEDFYPAYYEESDFCYRARRAGIEIYLSVRTRGRHLFSSKTWQYDPIRHAADQHQSRYRLICKQFSGGELRDFVEAETHAAASEMSFHESVGRVLASSYTLECLHNILRRRTDDGNESLSPAFRRLLSVGFVAIYRSALQRSEMLALPGVAEGLPPPTFEEWQAQLGEAHRQIREIRTAASDQSQTPAADPSLRARLFGFLSGAYGGARAQHTLMQRLSTCEELLHALDHRMNLIETQLTLQEYRRRLSDILRSYAHR